ncbi:hypothetical protein [Algoriphagus ratkowskyi]|uniref:hypothetical protein n=1 Tax=Algoriphagus ratkowskyi TaxID=57028 RepID=UPI00130257C1|nr:hypothetical protein [Algoriphagus ratkowskyi]
MSKIIASISSFVLQSFASEAKILPLRISLNEFWGWIINWIKDCSGANTLNTKIGS